MLRRCHSRYKENKRHKEAVAVIRFVIPVADEKALRVQVRHAHRRQENRQATPHGGAKLANVSTTLPQTLSFCLYQHRGTKIGSSFSVML